MTVAIDDLIEFEFSEQNYFSERGKIYAPNSIVLDDLVELEVASAVYYATTQAFYGQNSLDLDWLFELEFADASYFKRNISPVFNLSRPDYLEIIPYVLPMLPGDTGFEIDLLFRDTPDITTEDLLDMLTYTGDIRLSLEDGAGILEIKQNDLERDAGLETALLVSLFTDRRATLEQVRAAGMDETDLRGWWGDEGAEEPIGSLVWLLGRAKITPETLTLFRDYALQAWQWLIQDGAAESITVEAERSDVETILLQVVVKRPQSAESVNFRWYYNWEAQQVRRA